MRQYAMFSVKQETPDIKHKKEVSAMKSDNSVEPFTFGELLQKMHDSGPIGDMSDLSADQKHDLASVFAAYWIICDRMTPDEKQRLFETEMSAFREAFAAFEQAQLHEERYSVEELLEMLDEAAKKSDIRNLSVARVYFLLAKNLSEGKTGRLVSTPMWFFEEVLSFWQNGRKTDGMSAMSYSEQIEKLFRLKGVPRKMIDPIMDIAEASVPLMAENGKIYVRGGRVPMPGSYGYEMAIAQEAQEKGISLAEHIADREAERSM